MSPQLRTSFQTQPPTPTLPLRSPSPLTDYKKPLLLRLQDAKQWLQENPTESVITTSRLFKINYQTLYSSIKRPVACGRGGQNKILQEHQTKAIHTFIRDLLSYGIQPTMRLVFQSIYTLKQASNSNAMPPSKAWFGKWWKANHLHKIKLKPLAALRITAQDETTLRLWFREYTRTIAEKGIKRKNILNFDETSFRVSCPKGQSLLVPKDVAEVSISLLSICLSAWLAIWLSGYLAIWLSGCLALWLSGYLSIYIY
jgi:hypothetical protein